VAAELSEIRSRAARRRFRSYLLAGLSGPRGVTGLSLRQLDQGHAFSGRSRRQLRAGGRGIPYHSIGRMLFLARKRPPAGCRWLTIKARSARPYSERHLPQSRDIGRCSPASYGRGGVAPRAGCRSCDKSGRLSCAASSACHKGPTLSRCFQPSDATAGHIGGLICEDLHEVDLERDIGNRWCGGMVARLQRRSSTVP
jgi:hypothetical protein